MKATSLRLSALCFTGLILLAPLSASAGCESDRDCKGDRICVREACQDPVDPGERPMTRRPSSRNQQDLRAATRLRGASLRGIQAGWTFFSVGAAAGLGGIVTGIAGVDAEIAAPIGGAGVLLLAVADPLVGSASVQARRGLALLSKDRWGPTLPIVGWLLYGVTVLGGVGAVAAGAAGVGEVAAIAGIPPLLTGIGATIVFQIDASHHRRKLVEAIEELDSTAALHRPAWSFELGMSPCALARGTPGSRAPALCVAGRF